MSEESNVIIEQASCQVCSIAHNVGVISDNRLHALFGSEVVTHFQMCPAHEKLNAEGYIALVGVDPTRSLNMTMSGVVRTGKLAFVKADAWNDLFNVPVPVDGVCFATDAAIDKFNNRQSNQNDSTNAVGEIKEQSNN